MPAMNLTRADRPFIGGAQPADKSAIRAGAELAILVHETFTPTVAAANNIAASQAVSAGATAVLNGSLLSGGRIVLDVPRNVVGAWTTNSVITIRGKDAYGNLMTEVGASAATFTGVKAFKEILSITSSVSITGATFGTGIKLGLKYRPRIGGFVRGRFGEDTADAGTYVPPERTTSTGTTVDVRGTYAYAGTANGTNVFSVQYTVFGGPEDKDLFGIPQFNS